MAPVIISFLIIQSLICKVISGYAQPTVQQYVHLTGLPQTMTIPGYQNSAVPSSQVTKIAATSQPRPTTGLQSFPALNLPSLISNLANNQPSTELTSFPALALSNLVSNLPPSQLRSSTGLQSYPALSQPNVVTNIQRVLEQPKHQVKAASSSSIDCNLLNNLAIALQLLIVSNILNSPSPDAAKPEAKAHPEPIPPNPIMPNSNFVGGSGFSEPVFSNHKPTRNNMNLLSPYEALGPISPYSEPMSRFGSPNPRQDFMSPYTMLDKDTFSMDSLF